MDEAVVAYARLLCEMVLEALRYATPDEGEYILEPEGPTKQAKNTVVVIPPQKVEAIRKRYEKLFEEFRSTGQLVPKLHVTRTDTGRYIVGELVLVQEVTEHEAAAQPMALAYVKVETHHLPVHEGDVPVR